MWLTQMFLDALSIKYVAARATMGEKGVKLLVEQGNREPRTIRRHRVTNIGRLYSPFFVAAYGHVKAARLLQNRGACVIIDNARREAAQRFTRWRLIGTYS
ncbi:hypothetical protein Aspvir_003283 [Aspergillus viridinutans]|uniref:Uncharacterized protein n=1 Tax=Aspergillus viridinutans TaxID=75553 RepID=A0A9P3F6I9_ASPVI|nr:uncharacterized protein Aspvir_003283 [Aspergillus viridinutans]GIK07617.1 hypothetical protein Aspvir_003283 [Aspergillus viridinutans]